MVPSSLFRANHIPCRSELELGPVALRCGSRPCQASPPTKYLWSDLNANLQFLDFQFESSICILTTGFKYPCDLVRFSAFHSLYPIFYTASPTESSLSPVTAARYYTWSKYCFPRFTDGCSSFTFNPNSSSSCTHFKRGPGRGIRKFEDGLDSRIY